MRFYNQQRGFYCGIDLHARKMFECITLRTSLFAPTKWPQGTGPGISMMNTGSDGHVSGNVLPVSVLPVLLKKVYPLIVSYSGL